MTDDYWGPMPDDSEYPTPRERLDDGEAERLRALLRRWVDGNPRPDSRNGGAPPGADCRHGAGAVAGGAAVRACIVCGGSVPDEVRGRRWQRRVCVACHNVRERELYAERRRSCPPPSRPLVGDPVRYLLAAVMERAMADLGAFGRPLSERWQRELDDGVSCDPVGCDTDARDALRWLSGYGADWCELLDLPREWAREVTDARMLAQQEALSA